MLKSSVAVDALDKGKKVTRDRFEVGAFLFIKRKILYYQRNADAEPTPYQLDGRDIKAQDWRVL